MKEHNGRHTKTRDTLKHGGHSIDDSRKVELEMRYMRLSLQFYFLISFRKCEKLAGQPHKKISRENITLRNWLVAFSRNI